MNLYQAIQGYQFFGGCIQNVPHLSSVPGLLEVLPQAIVTDIGDGEATSLVLEGLRRVQEGYRGDSENLKRLLAGERDLFVTALRNSLRAQALHTVAMPEQFEKTPDSAYANPHLFVGPSDRFYVWAPFTKKRGTGCSDRWF